jgi:HlyD family secretion protein
VEFVPRSVTAFRLALAACLLLPLLAHAAGLGRLTVQSAIGQPLLKVVDISSMIVNAMVNQVDAEKIRVGQRAQVRFDAFLGLVLPARVHSIGVVPKSSRYRPDFVKEIPVLLKLEKTDPRIIPDLSVSADVIVEEEEKAPVAPREALHAGEGGAQFVYVRQPGGWQQRRVEPGLASNTRVAIRNGLGAGEVIALERPAPGKR